MTDTTLALPSIPDRPWTSLRERAADCRFDDVATALLFLTIAIGACLMPAQSDTWWMLRAGEDTWALGRPILHDLYSYTVYGSPWPNHEWLSQALFFAVYRVGGLPLVTLAAASAICAAWAIVWRLAPAPPLGRLLLVLFVLAPSSASWSLRPQVLTLLCLAICLHLVAHRRVWLLPPLLFIWANLHGGFVLGLAVIAGSVLSVLVTNRRRAAQSIAAAAASVAVTLATPLGFRLWTEIPASLGRLHAYDVIEWRAPALREPLLLPFWLVVGTLIALSLWRLRAVTRASVHERVDMLAVCIAALVMVPLAIDTARNVPPFLLAAVPALAALVPASWWPRRRNAHERAGLNRTIIAGACAATVAAVAYAYTAPLARLKWTPLPQASLDALSGCPGPLYNRYDEGGYLIWFARGTKVFIDSRQDPYPPALVQEHIDVERTGAYAHMFARYGIRCAYVQAGSPLAQRLAADGWTPLYADNRWAVLSTR